MSTLADILIDVSPGVPLDEEDRGVQVRRHVRSWLKDTPVIVVNEVARYFFDIFWEEHGPLDKGRDFPNVAPPFPCFWMEYRVPRIIVGGDPPQRVPMELGGQRVGFYWLAVPLEEVQGDAVEGWRLISFMFVEDSGCAVGPVFSVQADTESRGQLVELLADHFVPPGDHFTTEEEELLGKNMVTLHYPTFLAICFMHCSNVQVQDHPPKESHKRKHQKLYGRPPVVYKTLNITPMRRVIRSQGGPTCGLKQALHIMRAHFKRFEEKPLFGKHKGMWWWESQVRGRLHHGYIKKTYEVHSPKKDESES